MMKMGKWVLMVHFSVRFIRTARLRRRRINARAVADTPISANRTKWLKLSPVLGVPGLPGLLGLLGSFGGGRVVDCWAVSVEVVSGVAVP